MDYKDCDIKKIKFKKTTKFNENTFFIGTYYETDTTKDKVIFKTPRLMIGFSCKKFDQYSKCSYSYALDLNDDDEFVKYIQSIDSLIIDYIKKIKSSLKLDELIYNSSLINNNEPIDDEGSENESFFLKLKLITDKKNEVMTLIHFNNRKAANYNDLLSGMYSTQYIELSGITIRDNNIYVNFLVHQVVIIPAEKVFLKKSLLDEVSPVVYNFNPIERLEPTYYKKPESSENKKNDPIIIARPMLTLDPSLLLSMKSKLKKTTE